MADVGLSEPGKDAQEAKNKAAARRKQLRGFRLFLIAGSLLALMSKLFTSGIFIQQLSTSIPGVLEAFGNFQSQRDASEMRPYDVYSRKSNL